MTDKIVLLDDTDHIIKGDPYIEGDFDLIKCPYCGSHMSEVWDYGLCLYKFGDIDSMLCDECDREFIVVKGDDTSSIYSRKKHIGLESASERFDKELAFCRKSFEDHILVKTLDSDGVLAFYIKRKDVRIMSTYIVMTPEGIVITGDLCPCRYGVVSMLGYGVDWFSRKHTNSYLCEKFPSIDLMSSDHVWLVAIQEKFHELYKPK